MSLESGSYIKDLVASNPEGTDPKSQGDDHLRLIKQVLKSQFAGFTQGIALACTEAMLNNITGNGGNRAPRNIDTGASAIDFYGVVLGTTGTIPPGGNTGDFVLTFPWDGNRMFQIWLGTFQQTIWYRVYNSPTWGTWQDYRGLGMGQQWTAPSRSFNTDYTNTFTRPITVCVTASSAVASPNSMHAYVDGLQIVACQIQESTGAALVGFVNNLTFIVPPGKAYAVNVDAAAVLQLWRELV